MIKATIEGRAILDVKLWAMRSEITGMLNEAVVKAAKPFEDYAVGAAPVDSGGLARSITIRRMRRAEDGAYASVRIGPAWSVHAKQGVVEYGRFHEYGTSKMAAHPFLRPAFDAGRDEALRIFIAEMKRRLT